MNYTKNSENERAKELASNLAAKDTCNPHAYGRIMSHYRAGILTLKNLQEGEIY